MYLAQLSLQNFRSYAELKLDFSPGVNLLLGPNGAGKTNVVEAIYYLSSGGSHRVASDQALLHTADGITATQALIRAELIENGRSARLDLPIGKGPIPALLNGSKSPPRQLIGLAQAVIFAPEDLHLVKSDPATRRKFLDDLLTALTPAYLGLRQDYERVLRQRVTLLKSANRLSRAARSELTTLDIWDEQLVKFGAEIFVRRRSLLRELAPLVAQNYKNITNATVSTELNYQPNWTQTVGNQSTAVADSNQERQEFADWDLAAAQAHLAKLLAQSRDQELDRAVNLWGPHRDEVIFELNGLPVKTHASHGEGWSFALALKLAAYDLLSQQLTARSTPILILDDVFAELDEQRRQALIQKMSGAEQIFITAAVPQDVPHELRGQEFAVGHQTVMRVPNGKA